MKKILLVLLGVVALCQGASAQLYYQDNINPDILHHTACTPVERRNIVIPDVNGYKVFKADLHTHTFFSDGHLSPDMRIREAWMDGLDILAITDHLEWRKFEPDMIKFLRGYVPKGTKPVNYAISKTIADENGIKVDLNAPFYGLQKSLNYYGIMVIRGIEVTRRPELYGHFNALFTKNNNTIYDDDPEKSILNARAQGAIIMHNHPGWKRESLEMHEFEQRVYEKGLIDGIEIMNTNEFYPKAIDRAKKYGFFMASSTDIHNTTADFYLNGQIRNFTMILDNECTEEGVREALAERRTIAYSFGTMAGEESLLKALFEACVSAEDILDRPDGKKLIRLVNNSSLPFVLKAEGQREITLSPMSQQNLMIKGDTMNFTVENMWHGADSRLSVCIVPQKK
ncbi:MAG: histidinol-phosphatase [Tidjanibacter sp.]|nr:histidinol-phosphatase [Tidjanibacter sp.]